MGKWAQYRHRGGAKASVPQSTLLYEFGDLTPGFDAGAGFQSSVRNVAGRASIPVSGTITSVQLALKQQTVTPATGTMAVVAWAQAAGVPTTVIGSPSDFVSRGLPTTSWGWIEFVFPTPVAVSGAWTVGLVSSVVVSSNYVLWGADASAANPWHYTIDNPLVPPWSAVGSGASFALKVFGY